MAASTPRHELLRLRINRLRRALRGVADGDMDAVHRTRVAMRRLRELLPLLELNGETTQKLARRLRKTRRRLGIVRELDVLGHMVGELQRLGQYPARALDLMAQYIAAARQAAWRKTNAKRTAVEVRGVVRSLEHIRSDLETVDERGDRKRKWRWAIDARVARRAARLRDAVEAAGALYTVERLHGVRIALKKLRYGMELAAESSPGALRKDLRTLKRVQELLGRLHDLQVLVDRVRMLQASMTAPDVNDWRDLDALLISLERTCRRLHARYVRDRAGVTAICQRLGQKPTTHVRDADLYRAG
jgi:CHAD domain-containing protein